jgi:hypothetical protein
MGRVPGGWGLARAATVDTPVLANARPRSSQLKAHRRSGGDSNEDPIDPIHCPSTSHEVTTKMWRSKKSRDRLRR